MKRTVTFISLLVLTAPLLFGEGRIGPKMHPPELRARGIPAGTVRPKVFVLDGDDVVPQIANGELGGGQIFFTEFNIQNITNAPAEFIVDYFGPNGDPLLLPELVNEDPEETEEFSGFEGSVPAKGVRFATTWPYGAEVRLGYAVVTSVPPGAVVVTALYNNLVPGSRLFQAGIPMTTRNHDRLFSVFTNRFGQRSSLALVSLSEQLVTVNARDSEGVTRCSFNRMMVAGEHFPFLVQNELPCTVEALKGGSLASEGTLEVFGPDASLAAVGFVAQDEGLGAFTTIQVAGEVP